MIFRSDDDAVSAVYSIVDRLLCDGHFDTVDFLLDGVDVESSTVLLGLAWASITYAAKEHLRMRQRYMARLRAHLEKVRPDDVEALLRGLEDEGEAT